MATPIRVRQVHTRVRPRHIIPQVAPAERHRTSSTAAVKARHQTTASTAAVARPWPQAGQAACLITVHTLHSHNQTTSRTRHHLLADHLTDSHHTEVMDRRVGTTTNSRTQDSHLQARTPRRTKEGTTGLTRAVLGVLAGNRRTVANHRTGEVRPEAMEDTKLKRKCQWFSMRSRHCFDGSNVSVSAWDSFRRGWDGAGDAATSFVNA